MAGIISHIINASGNKKFERDFRILYGAIGNQNVPKERKLLRYLKFVYYLNIVIQEFEV